MSRAHAIAMTEAEVHGVVEPILRKRLKLYEVRAIHVKEEEDFDGAYIFRVVVDVEHRVEARDLIDALGDIHMQLRRMGEDRFVYLSTRRHGADAMGDAEEDID